MAQQISPLRQRLIDNMTIRNMSPLTQKLTPRRILLDMPSGPTARAHSALFGALDIENVQYGTLGCCGAGALGHGFR